MIVNMEYHKNGPIEEKRLSYQERDDSNINRPVYSNMKQAKPSGTFINNSTTETLSLNYSQGIGAQKKSIWRKKKKELSSM